MNKYSRLGKNSLLIFIGSIGSKLVAILMLPFYTTWLSVEEYGDVDLVSTYASLMLSIISLCMTDAIFRFPQGKSVDEQKTYFSTGLAVSIGSFVVFGSIFLCVISIWGQKSWGVIYSYSGYIVLCMVCTFVQLFIQQFCRSIDKMLVYVKSGVLLTLLTGGFSLLLVPRFGANGYLDSIILGCFGSFLYTYIRIKGGRYFSLKSLSLGVAKEMMAYSAPMIPNATLWWILGTSNRLFLEFYIGVDSVGIFALANRFPTIITLVFNTFFLSWQISVLEEFEKEDFSIFYNNIMRACFASLLFVSICLSGCSYWIVRLMAAPEYISAWRYIPFLGLAAVFSTFSTYVGSMFMALKKTRYFLTTSLWGGAICLLLNTTLIRPYGIMGATISLMISHFVIMFLRIMKANELVALQNRRFYLIQIFLAFLIGLLVISHISISVRLIGCLIISLVFFVMNYSQFLKLLNKIYLMIKRHE